MSANDARRRLILDLIASAGYESVQSLSQRLQVSEMTIRRDLDELEGRGLLKRIHGGAVADQIGEHLSVDFKVRRSQRSDAKASASSRAAAERIVDGQSVYLDAGSTVLAIADALGARSRLDRGHPLPAARQRASPPAKASPPSCSAAACARTS